MQLENIIERIQPLEINAMDIARRRLDNLTKPPGSLGRLEDLAVQIAGIRGGIGRPLKSKLILTMAGDHGVVAEGVSAYPQEVTPQMVLNILSGGAAINVLSRHFGARVLVVDMGMASDLPAQLGLAIRKIAAGTGNIARGPAMSRQQALDSLLAGAEVIENEVKNGLDILGVGEMGIGNTTPAAAIAAALTGCSLDQAVGRGTGVDDTGLQRKTKAVQRALDVNQPDGGDGLDMLAKIGGFEIGGMAGAMLAAAALHVPVMLDGFISTAAAMIAVVIAPQIKPYLIASHCSQENGHRLMLKWLGKTPLVELNFRLGEGTGAVIGISLAEAAVKIMDEMATFEEAGVSGKEE
ncbi:MAG: nicotinate-nucleotide--dimethylbenzimidazole phosphoribosyltransferase [Anaerolineaceae bacterium]